MDCHNSVVGEKRGESDGEVVLFYFIMEGGEKSEKEDNSLFCRYQSYGKNLSGEEKEEKIERYLL